MTTKIIDLLKDIADGNQPYHIRFKNKDWYWGYDTYTTKECLNNTPDEQISLFTAYRIDYCLNDTVEILDTPKGIEPIEMVGCNVRCKALDTLVGTDTPLATEIAIDKINELIKVVNNLDK